MVPTGGSRTIAIVDAKCSTETEVVFTKIAGKINPVFFIDLVVAFYIEVIKV